MIAIFIAAASVFVTYYGLWAWERLTGCPAPYSEEWYDVEFARIASELPVVGPDF